MAELTEADRYLLQRIARGDAEGWSQLVERYQGRLLAFARSRLSRKEEAEDLVQDTFIAFLEGLKNFRENASVETFLFTILRRKLIDFFRGKQMRVCFLQEALAKASDDTSFSPVSLESPDATASFYMRREEQSEMLRAGLADALEALLERLRKAENFRDLQIVEMLFYAQLRNKEVARLMNMDEKAIALIKHRCLKEIKEHATNDPRLSREEIRAVDSPAWEETPAATSLLTEVWEQRRPTCPKRSTVGRFLLGTLDGPWQKYVDFHINQLGCQFCRANLEDLRKQTEQEPSKAFQARIYQSTIGFFRPRQA
jgi:RNA polymerase sigma factor (sigma-70 family)